MFLSIGCLHTAFYKENTPIRKYKTVQSGQCPVPFRSKLHTIMKNYALLLFALLLLTTACNPIYYSPTTHNVPLLRQKGDVRIALSGAEKRIGLDAAYAVDQHIGIVLSGGSFFPADDEQGDGGKGKFVETGFGYFKPISNHLLFETYGLIGYGNVENHFPSTLADHPTSTGIIQANMLRYGIQPNIAFTSTYFDAAFSLRTFGLNYFNASGNLLFENEDQLTYLKKENRQFIMEPALTLRAGYKYIKGQFQFGWSRNLSNSEFRQDDVFATLGLIYALDR
jgi:hypothetical protein